MLVFQRVSSIIGWIHPSPKSFKENPKLSCFHSKNPKSAKLGIHDLDFSCRFSLAEITPGPCSRSLRRDVLIALEALLKPIRVCHASWIRRFNIFQHGDGWSYWLQQSPTSPTNQMLRTKHDEFYLKQSPVKSSEDPLVINRGNGTCTNYRLFSNLKPWEIFQLKLKTMHGTFPLIK